MNVLRNIVALAALVVIPTALILGWNKHLTLAWLLLLLYAATLGFLTWQARR